MESVVPRGVIGEPGTASESTGSIEAATSSSRTNFISAMRILMAISAVTTIIFDILFCPLAFLPAVTTGLLFSIMVGVLLIFLIFVMLAAARRSEMGMARAVGAKRSHLIQMFVFEGTAYALDALVRARQPD